MAASRRKRSRVRWVAVTPCLLAGCAVPIPAPTFQPLPPLSVSRAVPLQPDPTAARVSAIDGLPSGPLVTLEAVNVEVRALLLALARDANLNLVIDPAVRGRITASFTDVPVREALRAVASVANVSLTGEPVTADPVIFYALPIDIRHASADMIQNRYGVSAEVAGWIVENQP